MTQLFIILWFIASIFAAESRTIPSGIIACLLFGIAGFFFLL